LKRGDAQLSQEAGEDARFLETRLDTGIKGEIMHGRSYAAIRQPGNRIAAKHIPVLWPYSIITASVMKAH